MPRSRRELREVRAKLLIVIHTPSVIPAEAGIQSHRRDRLRLWIPDQVRDDE